MTSGGFAITRSDEPLAPRAISKNRFVHHHPFEDEYRFTKYEYENENILETSTLSPKDRHHPAAGVDEPLSETELLPLGCIGLFADSGDQTGRPDAA